MRLWQHSYIEFERLIITNHALALGIDRLSYDFFVGR